MSSWKGMTKEQRSKEMKRRMAVAKSNKTNSKVLTPNFGKVMTTSAFNIVKSFINNPNSEDQSMARAAIDFLYEIYES